MRIILLLVSNIRGQVVMREFRPHGAWSEGQLLALFYKYQSTFGGDNFVNCRSLDWILIFVKINIGKFSHDYITLSCNASLNIVENSCLEKTQVSEIDFCQNLQINHVTDLPTTSQANKEQIGERGLVSIYIQHLQKQVELIINKKQQRQLSLFVTQAYSIYNKSSIC